MSVRPRGRAKLEPDTGWKGGRKPEFKPDLALEAKGLASALMAVERATEVIGRLTWLGATMQDEQLVFELLSQFDD